MPVESSENTYVAELGKLIIHIVVLHGARLVKERAAQLLSCWPSPPETYGDIQESYTRAYFLILKG